jgi:hypothetical protein
MKNDSAKFLTPAQILLNDPTQKIYIDFQSICSKLKCKFQAMN